MKRFCIIIMVLIISAFLNAKTEYFGIKSGYVEYELSGNTSGTKTIWFDDFGRLTRTEINSSTTVEMFGIKNTTQEHTLSIKNEDYTYSIDLLENTGYKAATPHFDDNMNFDKMSDEARQAYYDKTLQDLGGEKLGKEKFLGKDCDVISLMGAKSWIYDGITLKTETSLMGVTNIVTAIKFDENIDVGIDKFSPPEGITWYDQYGQSEDMDYSEQYEDQEYDEDNEEMQLPGMSFEAFRNMIDNAEIPDYNVFNVSEAESVYMAVFLNSQSTSLIISAAYIDEHRLDEAKKMNESEKFVCMGKDAFYAVIDNELSNLSIVLKDQNTLLSITSTVVSPKEELIKIIKLLKF